MAEIHRRNPHLTSSQVQNLMMQQMTTRASGGVTTVDENRALRYMFATF